MQNYCKTIGALAAASALVAGNASAEVEYEIHTGYTSEYVFRGVDLGDHLAEVGLDVAGKYNQVGLSAGIWGTAYDASGLADDVSSETDLYAEANYDFGWATLAVGYIYYWEVGNLGVDNQEIYFQAAHDFGWATASVTYFWDLCENNGGNNGYTEFALSHSWELNPCLSLGVSTAVGLLTESGGEFTHWQTKATLDWGFAEHAKLSPFVGVSVALGDEAGTMWADVGNELFAGSMLSVSF